MKDQSNICLQYTHANMCTGFISALCGLTSLEIRVKQPRGVLTGGNSHSILLSNSLVQKALLYIEDGIIIICFVATLLKDKFTRKCKFSHYLLALILMESQVSRPQSISGASQQNGAAAFS